MDMFRQLRAFCQSKETIIVLVVLRKEAGPRGGQSGKKLSHN